MVRLTARLLVSIAGLGFAAAAQEKATMTVLPAPSAEQRRQAEAVLQRDPDNEAARRVLGHERVGGRWLTHAEAMKERGYVLFRGQWLRKYDVAVLEHRERQARERARLERELNGLFQRLASRTASQRDGALAQLEAVADRREWPQLAVLARQQKAGYDRFWTEYTATISVNLQKTELLSLTPYTTSLGTGMPVTLQLPSTRSVSIGTTVTVPAGTGR